MHEKEAKVLLSAQNGMNIYRGCTHGCIYCDARSNCYQMDFPFEDVEVKVNAVDLLEKALKSTSLLMEHGTTTYLEVLTARQSLLSAQLSQTANRFSEIQSVITLYQALGGGRE